MKSFYRYLFPALFVLTSCSSDEQLEECEYSRSDLSGSYEMITDEVSGDCGRIGSMLVKMENGVIEVADGLGCELTRSSWNGFICEANSVLDCDDGQWVMRLDWKVKVSEDGSLSGTLKTKMDRWSGIYTCESQYEFAAERTE